MFARSIAKFFVKTFVFVWLFSAAVIAAASGSNVLQPANGTVVRPGINFTLSGTAAGSLVIQNGEDREYFVKRVDILRNGTVVGSANFTDNGNNDDPPGYTWTYVDNVTTPGTYSYTSKAYDTRGVVQGTASSTRSVTILANSLPSVSVTAPGDGTVVNVIAGAMSLTTNASDNDGSISSVSYFANGTNIGAGAGSNFALNYGLPAAGNYAITATAVDNEGGQTTSSPISLYVRGPVTGNIDGIRTIAGGEPALVGWACDIATGLGIQVHFYRGGAYGTGQFVQAYNADQASEPGIGSSCGDSGVPHRFTIPLGSWSANFPGQTIFLHAISRSGGANNLLQNSGSFVIPPNDPPAVSIAAPGNNQAVPVGVALDLVANATDAYGGTISRVDFYQSGTLLGTGSLSGSQYHFAWTPSSTGSFGFTAVAYDNLGASTTSGVVTIPVNTGNNAAFASQSVPSSMVTGQTYPVTVTITNTGASTWTPSGNYHLGSAAPRDNGTWGLSRVNLPVASVAPGQSVTFTFNVTAPTANGPQDFQWQMVQDGVEWFGPPTADVVVQVGSGNMAAFASQSVPSALPIGQTATVHVIMTNNGASTWSQANQYRLSPVNPGGNGNWGVARVELPVASVAPGQSADFAFTVTSPSSNGTYNFQWQMLREGVEFFGAQSTAASVTVGTPPPVNITPPNLSGPLAGSIAASSAVSPSGAATYSVPIKIPPGTAGIAPQLSLEYSSQTMDGLLGVGWSIGGLSEITRCPRTLAQDAYAGAVRLDVNDRFCLDGQRLILVNGTYGADGAEYRTEIETFTRVISHTTTTAKGPDSFTVYLKGGEVRNYGTNGSTTESAVLAQGTSPAVNLKWAIGRSEDRRGNFMTYRYAQNSSTGEFYPTQITYTGNSATGLAPYNAVRFAFGARSDSILKYVAGAQVLINQRLTNIQTFVNVDGSGNGGTLAMDYRVAYTTNPSSARALVTSLTQCDTGGTCLPATQFSWQQRTSGDDVFTATVWGGPSNGATSQGTLDSAVLRGDFNGDGKLDLLTTDGNGNWNVCLSTGTSFDCQTWTGPTRALGKVLLGDFDGNGKTDIAIPPQSGTLYDYAQWQVCLANAANHSFDCQFWSGLNSGSNIGKYVVADFTGDGRDDIGMAGGGFSALCKSTGTAFDCSSIFDGFDGVIRTDGEDTARRWPFMADMDGDGRVDYYVYRPGGWTVYLTGDSGLYSPSPVISSAVPGNATTSGANGSINPDINGDGIADIVSINSNFNASSGVITPAGGSLCRSTGKALVCTSFPIDDSFLSGFGTYDADGDGIPDFVQQSHTSNNIRVCRISLDSAQNNVFNCSLWPSPALSSAAGLFYGDFTGRGKVDIALYNASTGQWSVASPGGDNTDLLTAVIDGAGARTQFSYKSTADASVFTKGTTAQYPQRDVQPAMRVVSEMRSDNGQGGFLTSDYRYAGYRNDLLGRGSLGFGSMDVVDGVTNVTTHAEYAQTFPYTGMSTKLVSTHSSGVELSHQENVLMMSNTANASVFFPYVQSSTQTTHDLNGASMLSTTMQVPSGGYDAYGNLLSSTTTVSTGSSTNTTTVATTYDNLVSQWLIGLPRQVQITRNLDGSSITRTATMDYDGFGAVAHASVEPTTPSLAVTTGYTRDAFGNVALKTLSWTDPASGTARQRNEEQSTFDARGRWPTIVTNALNQSETHVNRDIDGAMTSLTGPNNITTTWAYDGFGRKTQENRADGTSTTWAYRQCIDVCNYLATSVVVTQRLSGSTQVSVPSERFADAAGHFVQSRTWGFNGNRLYVLRPFDQSGRLSHLTRPFYDGAPLAVTTYGYDDLGRVVTLYEPSSTGSTLSSTTTYNGLSVTTRNVNNQTRTVTSNVFGKPSTIVDSGGYATSYAYDAFGNLMRTTDAKGNTINVAYDRLGRKTQLNDPDLGVSNFSVNPLGQVWKQVDSKNQTTRFTYDDLNRLTHRLEPDLDSNWIYDTAAQGIGKLAEAYTLRGDGTKDYRRVQAYDGLSRPMSSTITLDLDYVTAWTYDGLGRPSTTTYSRNAIGGSGGLSVGFTSIYNPYGYLGMVQSTGGSAGSHVEWQAVTQDAEQRVTREQLGDGRYTDRRFNVYTGTLDGISAGVDNGSGGDDASLENETYLYDALNDLTYRAQRKPDGSLLQESFGYDALNRLVSSQVSGQTQKTYGYDEIGNLIVKSDVGSYSYPASGAGSVRPHAVANISGSVAGQGNPGFGYDANGNLTSGANRTISWTSFDMPAAISRTIAGSGGVPVNVALASNGASASASSTYPDADYKPAGAINGDRSGAVWGQGAGWNNATYGNFPETLEVDFSGSKTINEIDVFSLQDNYQSPVQPTPSMTCSAYCLVTFDLEYWNGSTWVGVPNGHVTANNLVWKTVTFPAITTTKIHIIVRSASDGFTRLVELEAWTPGPIPASTNTAAFVYGPEHQRIRQTVTGSNPVTIYYAGAIEKEVTGSGTTVKTRMPQGIGYLSDASGETVVRYRYLRGDHLGSSVVVTDDTGAVLDRDSYDSWGQRRNADGSDDTTYSVKGYDRTGYTGEEMLDSIGLVHLNGRVYDPLVGRFVSADPTIPELNESQSLNRYTYVRNNPLNRTDPSGYADDVQRGETVYDNACKACIRQDGLNDSFAQLAVNSRHNLIAQLSRAIPALAPATGYRAPFGAPRKPTQEEELQGQTPPREKSLTERFLELLGILNQNSDDGNAGDKASNGEGTDGTSKGEQNSGHKKPDGVPEDWKEEPGKKDGNTKWVNPNNPHDYVREKPNGELTQVRDGRAYDEAGNKVNLDSPAAHGITPDRFIFRPRN